MTAPRARLLVPFCLGLLYVVWGSTYLAQRIAVRSLPPLQMAGLRFVVAGALLYAFVRLRGAARPTSAQLFRAALSALPFLVLGMGGAAVCVQRVSSGVVALVFASVPLWAVVFDALWSRRVGGGRLGDRVFKRLEVVGLALGFSGVAFVALRGAVRADPATAVLLVGSAACYAFGSVCTRRMRGLPPGAMGSATQMLTGGVGLLAASVAFGEPLAMPPVEGFAALGYLVVLGSVVGYSAFAYVLKNARPALATSHAFVNPVVALSLGAALGGERFATGDFIGLALVLGAVLFVALGAREPAPPARAWSSEVEA